MDPMQFLARQSPERSPALPPFSSQAAPFSEDAEVSDSNTARTFGRSLCLQSGVPAVISSSQESTGVESDETGCDVDAWIGSVETVFPVSGLIGSAFCQDLPTASSVMPGTEMKVEGMKSYKEYRVRNSEYPRKSRAKTQRRAKDLIARKKELEQENARLRGREQELIKELKFYQTLLESGKAPSISKQQSSDKPRSSGEHQSSGT